VGDPPCHSSWPGAPPFFDWAGECRNIEDRNQILHELEQGVGSDKCNSLVIDLMRKALRDQAEAHQARQRDNMVAMGIGSGA